MPKPKQPRPKNTRSRSKPKAKAGVADVPPPAPEYRAQLTADLAVVLEPGGAALIRDGVRAGTIRCRQRAMLWSIPDRQAAKEWQALAHQVERRLLDEDCECRLPPKPVDLNRIVWAWILDLLQLDVTATDWRITDHVDLEYGGDDVHAAAHKRCSSLPVGSR